MFVFVLSWLTQNVSTQTRQHSETGMIDIISRRCEVPLCMRRPLYNTVGLRAVFCSKHKLPGMIDVVSTRCKDPVRTRLISGCMPVPCCSRHRDGRAFTRAFRRCDVSCAWFPDAESPSCIYYCISTVTIALTRISLFPFFFQEELIFPEPGGAIARDGGVATDDRKSYLIYCFCIFTDGFVG